MTVVGRVSSPLRDEYDSLIGRCCRLVDNVMWPKRAMSRTDARDRRRVETAGALLAGDGPQSDGRPTKPTV